MRATPRGRADASVPVEAGRLVADAVMDSIADAVLSLMRRDEVASKSAPRRPVPSQVQEQREGGADRAHVADHAVVQIETALAAVVSAVLGRIDINKVLDRVDVQRVVDRVDVHAVVQRIDLNEALSEVDINPLLERVDVDAIVDRVDVAAVTNEALGAVDIGEVIRESTSSIGSDAVEGFRQQAMIADGLISRVVDRVLRRSGPRATALDAAGDGS